MDFIVFPDVDECSGVLPRHGCGENAFCVNTEGGFNCTCHEGFTGNGFECTGEDVALFLSLVFRPYKMHRCGRM